ncbi:substrate-binding domain-containing protein [Siccirubricoccus sp. KC 17139]|uniref:Substrate-binding domain-containing protein n=1 Tax=Siccirubricoccus soli TaxID=2899147 RepID=A0ABT1D3S4_9PROT|nr:substrate-binding domain-containing protein [Siccirubricoccus soli]MCO6416586.1 substrate-binding domain-containing protein [Siccirubricoccus soli]MCP2682721.1 substrate-binding domain-containing protein [Siccirubricoccus soli]
MADLVLLSTLGVVGVLRQALPGFGGTVDGRYGPTAGMLERIRGGERGDVAILTAEGIEALTAEGVLAAGTRVDLAASSVGIAVKAGAPKPDISTEEAFIRLLKEVPSLAYSRAGASGIYFAGLLERLGLAAEVNAKATITQGFTAERVARGETVIAVQQISELMAVEGVEIVGPLPPTLQTSVIFSGALFAGAAPAAAGLLRFIAEAATPALLRSKGLEPA